MTRSLSNLLKQSSVISKSERVIDYNELIKAKLQTILESQDGASANPDNFVSGLNADVVEELLSDQQVENTEGQNVQANALAAAQANIEAQRAQAKQMQEAAEQMVSEANKKSDSIVADAKNQSLVIMNNAREQGYQEGMKQAEDEIAGHKAQLDAEFERQRSALEADYQQMKSQMESELVEVLTDVFKNVTLTVAEDNQEIIMHLINGVLKNAEKSREFTIKVSPEDYRFLVANQGKLYMAMTKEATFDFVEDVNLSHNECIVETDGGVFDCSLDIELNNLVKKIKLLSCV